jgi:hypothetical protein
MELMELMPSHSSESALFFITALLAVFHMLSPDHWVPLSVLSWQRGLERREIVRTSALLVLAHLGLAVLIYGLLLPFVSGSGLDSRSVLRLGAVIVASVVVLRLRRFERMLEVFRGGNAGKGALLTVLSLMGPAESLVPLLLKARADGSSGLAVLALYGVLSVASLLVLTFGGHVFWNDPTKLARGLNLFLRPGFSVPVTAGLGLGLVLALQFA